MKLMLPKVHTHRDLYNRLHNGTKKIHKDILVYTLKQPQEFARYCKDRQEKYELELQHFEYKLRNGLIKD